MSNTNLYFSRPVDGGDNNLVSVVDGVATSFTPQQVRDALQAAILYGSEKKSHDDENIIISKKRGRPPKENKKLDGFEDK